MSGCAVKDFYREPEYVWMLSQDLCVTCKTTTLSKAVISFMHFEQLQWDSCDGQEHIYEIFFVFILRLNDLLIYSYTGFVFFPFLIGVISFSLNSCLLFWNHGFFCN